MKLKWLARAIRARPTLRALFTPSPVFVPAISKMRIWILIRAAYVRAYFYVYARTRILYMRVRVRARV